MNFLDLMLWAQGPNRPPNPFGPGSTSSGASAGDATTAFIFMGCYFAFILAMTIPALAGVWKAFVKAGEPGWASIVPVYNIMVMSKIAGKGEGHGVLVALLMFVPCINIVGLVLFI